MTLRAMKFHNLHSEGIRLSDRRTTAFLDDGGSVISFTDRPLAPKECLLVGFDSHTDDGEGLIRIGFTKKNPDTFERDIRDNPETGLKRMLISLADGPMSLRRTEGGYLIYIDEDTERTMIEKWGEKSGEPSRGRRATGPMYVCFVFSGRQSCLKILLNMDLKIVRKFQDAEYEDVHLITSKRSEVYQCGPCAVSEDDMPSRSNCAFIKTSLAPGYALIVLLRELKRKKPVHISLTTEGIHRAHSSGSSREFSRAAHSLELRSDIPEEYDLLGVWVSPDGGVYISHNLCEWFKRTDVDPDFKYDVIFAMENIRILQPMGMVEMTVDVDCEDEPQSIAKVPKLEPQGDGLTLCVACLDAPREMIVIPCGHFSLCVDCTSNIRATGSCPCCRSIIKDIIRVFR